MGLGTDQAAFAAMSICLHCAPTILWAPDDILGAAQLMAANHMLWDSPAADDVYKGSMSIRPSYIGQMSIKPSYIGSITIEPKS